MLSTSILLLVIVVGSFLWLDGMKTKEIALARARMYCNDNDLQLLDDTVSCARFRIKLTKSRPVIFRLYHIIAYDKMRNRRVKVPIYMHNHKVIKIGTDDDKVVKMSDYRSC